ncbi:MAG: DUF2203 family protein [Planctomycetes bacterium]|nr:DUF2203 family protein [Planctomycetota bacterium]
MSGSRSYPTSDASESPERGEVVLSLKTVHKMLPLVQQIAQDIVDSHAAMSRLHPEEERLDRDRHSLDWPGRQRRYEIKEDLARADKSLEVAHAELRDLGVNVLDDLLGRVGFPTLVNNRRAYFSWVLGEDGLHTWRFADEDVDRPIPVSWLKELAFAAKS